MQRLVIYSHDTFGLGNMRRMTAIAEHLVRTHGDLNILLISGSSALPAFQLPDRIDYIKLPCLARDAAGRYSPRSLSMALHELTSLRASLIDAAIRNFAPELILVDKKPFGVNGELEPVLRRLRQQVRRPKLVLLLRDILDDPEATRSAWSRTGYHDAIDACYEAVLVVGDARVFDMAKEYAFPASTHRRLRYCGYVNKSTSATATGTAAPDSVLVTPGGGEDGALLVDTYIDALASLPAASVSHIILGPDMPAAQATRFEARLANSNRVICQRFTTAMDEHMRRASVLVSMAGYNTVYEGLSLGKRMVVVPRTRPSREQEIRAQRLAQLGSLTCIHPRELTPQRLSAAVCQALRTSDSGPHLDFDGLANVERALMEMLP
ncbi:MAG: glycosyltransferase [Pseudomonadales bacterium]